MSTIEERISKLSPAKRALLEQHLQQQRAKNIGSAVNGGIPRHTDTAPPPLSFAQERLWFLDQLEPGGTAYNEQAALRLTGPLAVDALEASLAALVARHAIYRTHYRQIDGNPVQVIEVGITIPLRRVDLRKVAPAERAAAMRDAAIQDATQPYDLAHDPIVRFTLLRLDEEEHLFLRTVHHIANDGWSNNIFWRELNVLYNARIKNQPPLLPDLPIAYADYAVWQRQWLAAGAGKQQRAYWRNQLAGLAPLDLSTDRPRPAVQTHSGSRHTFSIAAPAVAALNDLVRTENATPFMLLLAAFQVLLHRYSGQDDIAVGSPIAGRSRSETEQIIGFFVNTLVLRGNLADNPPFRTLLRQIRTTCLDAYTNQDLPFAHLVAELQPERNLSVSPLFQVFFALQNAPRSPLQLADITAEPLHLIEETAKFDLSLYLHPEATGLRAIVEYNTDLFAQTTIERLADHFCTLLSGIVENADTPIGYLPLLTEPERQQLLFTWNDTQAPYPADLCIHQLFEAQVAQMPATIALIGDTEQLTYHELNLRANQLADHLLDLGIGPGDNVGVCMQRSLEMVVGLLAILKVGGAYVPLDPGYPRERLTFMVAEAKIALLLTQSHIRLPVFEGPYLLLDAWWKATPPPAPARSRGGEDRQNKDKAGNPACRTTPDDVAYLLFTSGSTGKPKGVMGLHRGAVNRIHWMQQRYPFAVGEVCCQKTSLNFVDSVAEIFGPLAAGVPLVLIPDDVVRDPRTLLNTLAQHGVTRLVLVPSLLRTILDASTDLDMRLPKLTLWVCSGEALPAALAKRFHQQLPGRTLLNFYGSSEVAADVTWYEMNDIEMKTAVPIGRPIANTQIYILDRYQQPVPVGVPGLLHVGGAGLARGYLSPTLTAERFVSNPFGRGQLYNMGDRARYRADGTIEFLGRIDNQVNVRGFRVELGEIEATLRSHAAVDEAVVVARKNTSGEDAPMLVAYIVAPSAPAPALLRDYLAETLPGYMVPAVILHLNALPLTPNGKVDRLALPPLDYTDTSARERVALHTPVEQQVAVIWMELLGVEQVGIHDNFFALGGHSLLAVRLLAQIEQEVGQEVSLNAFFHQPTVAHLAHLLAGEVPESPPEFELAQANLTANLSVAQQAAVQRLRKELADPTQPQTWLAVLGDKVWHRRRKAIHRALSTAPYPLTHWALAQFLRVPWLANRFFRKEVALTQQFLTEITHRHTDLAALTARTLLYNCLDYYRIGLNQTTTPHLEGEELLDSARARGKGIIFVAMHDTLFGKFKEEPLAGAMLIGGVQNYLAHHQIHDETVEQALFAQQLHTAVQLLQSGGSVRILPDGHRGHHTGIEVNFHGRRRLFRNSFAELALMTGATVIAVMGEVDSAGNRQIRLMGPLSTGDEQMPHMVRVEMLIQQYVDLLHHIWAEAPWLVPWYQMARHLAYPPSIKV